MGFSWEEYWSGLLFPTPGGLQNPETKLHLLHLHWQASSLPLELRGNPPIHTHTHTHTHTYITESLCCTAVIYKHCNTTIIPLKKSKIICKVKQPIRKLKNF